MPGESVKSRKTAPAHCAGPSAGSSTLDNRPAHCAGRLTPQAGPSGVLVFPAGKPHNPGESARFRWADPRRHRPARDA